MKFISCFSGIEAASVASKHIGWKALAFSEIEPFASAVLAHHYPEVPNVGDITKANWGEYNGKADIVVGGSPCQSYSIAGLRKSLDDERGNLTLEYMRAIHSIKPRWIMWENVTGVFTAKGNPFGQFLAGLCGYDSSIEPPNDKWTTSGWITAANEESYSVAWRVLDAQHFGVPQRRRRIFLVGHIGTRNWWKPLEVLFERKSEGWNPPQSRDKGKSITESSGSCFAIIMGQTGANGTNVSIDVSPTLDRASPPAVVPITKVVIPLNTMTIMGRPSDDIKPRMGSGIGKETDPCPTITKAHSHAVCISETMVSVDTDRVVGSLCARDFKGVGNQYVSEGKVVVMHPSQIAFDSRQDCISSEKVFGALSSSLPQSQAVIAPVVRRITPVECARLQGFPDTYLDVMLKGKAATDGHKYKALGNSWAIPCVKWIFDRLQQVDSIEANT